MKSYHIYINQVYWHKNYIIS